MNIDKIAEILSSRVLVRYLLEYTHGHETFVAELISAPGRPEMQDLVHVRVLVTVSTSVKPSISWQYFSKPQSAAALIGLAGRWEETAQNNTGYALWTKPDEFVGVIIDPNICSQYLQRSKPNSVHWLFYNAMVAGLVSEVATLHASLKYPSLINKDAARALKRLDGQFQAFATQAKLGADLGKELR